METEVLTCVVCSATWQRPKVRGRKPKLCASCLSNSIEVIPQDSIQVHDEEVELPLSPEEPPPPTVYKPGSRWQCQSCKAKIKIGVGINEPPMHKCPKKANRVLQLSLI